MILPFLPVTLSSYHAVLGLPMLCDNKSLFRRFMFQIAFDSIGCELKLYILRKKTFFILNQILYFHILLQKLTEVKKSNSFENELIISKLNQILKIIKKISQPVQIHCEIWILQTD